MNVCVPSWMFLKQTNPFWGQGPVSRRWTLWYFGGTMQMLPSSVCYRMPRLAFRSCYMAQLNPRRLLGMNVPGCLPCMSHVLPEGRHRRSRKFPMSIQPAKACEYETFMVSGPVCRWPTQRIGRLLVLVPHETPHGIMRIQENLCMLLPKALKLQQ